MKREVVTAEQGRKLLAKRSRKNDLSLNEMLAAQLTAAGIPFEREFRFNPDRRWRADFLIGPTVGLRLAKDYGVRLLSDIDGGTFTHGKSGHNTGSGIAKSFEKFNEASIMGFRVLRFDGPMVRDGIALQTIQRALGIGLHKGLKAGHAR